MSSNTSFYTPKVEKIEIPDRSKLFGLLERFDFQECYTSHKVIPEKINAPFAFKKLFESPPTVVLVILKIRDFFFKIFGLKTANDVPNPIKFVDLPVDRDRPMVSDMDMSYNSPREVIWGLQDTHLTFAVSVYVNNEINSSEKNECTVYVSTVLKYNNTWGKVYFAFIRRIHGFVIESMLKKLMISL